jgi:ribosomal protein S27E
MTDCYCKNCGYTGKPKRYVPGSVVLEVLLWLFLILPGVIYSGLRRTRAYNGCPRCQAPNMVPLDSPVGRRVRSENSASDQFFEATCPKCSAKVAVFSGDHDRLNCACGAALFVDRREYTVGLTPAVADVDPVCRGCGRPVSKGSAFCSACGQRIDSPSAR